MRNTLQRWFGRHFDPPGPRFIIHPNYQTDLPDQEYDGQRPFRILAYLEKRRLLRRGMLSHPRPASLKRLQMVHDRDYLHALQEPGALDEVIGFPVDSEVQETLLAVQRTMCGGTLRATRHALRRRWPAMNLGGGLHHAARDRGSGFCVFNDVAVAVACLRGGGHDQPVLVVDLDIHDGDGTRAIFAEDPGVHTFSIHNRDLDRRPAVASTSIALGADVDDATYLAAVREHLPRVFAEVQPGFVYYLAGADPSVDDRLGNWRVSLEGLLARDRFVLDLAGHGRGAANPIPCVILTAGGYGRRAWRHGAALGSWLLTGDATLDIPLDIELPVGHYRRLARLMRDPGEGKDGASAGDDWGLSHDEVAGLLDGPEKRFLGCFGRHGIEMAAEESGLLDRLRQRGYRDLRLELELDDPVGHTMRIVTGGARPRTLLEVRLRVDRAAMPGRTLMMVEWLLIQDAGQRYELTRPLLPGQRHPGLGLLRDTAAVLVVVCERLDLDGLAFTPSHYHLARLARPQARFRDPEREGWFRAVDRAVRHLRLPEAVSAVEQGRVRDAAGGTVLRWEPSLLVIPLSEDLAAYFARGPWAEAADGAAASLEGRLE